ncbi:PepSY-associated TM helix domain-containing protein [Tsuneonella sp. HG249]
MRLLALLHGWAGGLIGLALSLLGLSGALLVWKDDWTALPYADAVPVLTPAALAQVTERATAGGELSRLTFAGDTLGLHQAIYSDGGGAYFGPQAQEVARWASQWERPELWLFDFHHHLFMGEAGELATGVFGVAGVLFVLTGTILWWRTRKTFAPRPWPARMTRPAIVRQHRDLGIVAAPLLLLSMATGTLMLFKPLAATVLAPWGSLEPPAKVELPNAGVPGPDTDWAAMFTAAQARFPAAALRRLQFPREASEPVVLRLRQPFEWTPNGRTYLKLDPASGKVLAVDDPAKGNAAQMTQDTFYPLHAAKVGGLPWKLAITLSGLALAMLGSLAMWSFWFRRRKPARGVGPGAPLPAAA